MNNETILRHAISIWLLFPAIAIPVSLIAHKLGHSGFISRLFVWFIIIPVFLFCSYYSTWLFFILLFCCTIIVSFELVGIDASNSNKISRHIIALSTSLPWLFWAQYDDQYPWAFVPVIIVISLFFYYLKYHDIRQVYHLICLNLFVGVSLSYWILLQRLSDGFRFVLFAFSVIVITDIMAFLSGKMLAGLKFFPKLSPNKTWAGFAGGGVSAVLTSFIFWFAIPELSHIQIIYAGILIAVSGATGDLIASAVKRYHRVKDFSRMLGPMGGMLDRLDSMIGSGWLFFLYLKIVL